MKNNKTLNQPELWNDLWNKNVGLKEDLLCLTLEQKSIRWQRIAEKTAQIFSEFNGLNVIEIGAGQGTYAALMGKLGARVTILDYSTEAIKRSREFLSRNGIEADFIIADALKLPSQLLGKFDISFSFGLSEHFKNDSRIIINKAHFDLLRPGGLTFISVPNSACIPYRLWKLQKELTNKWNFGEEYPYTRKEFRDICKKLGIQDYSFMGDSAISSLNYFNPLKNIIRYFRKKRYAGKNFQPCTLKEEKGTFLDEYIAPALVLCGRSV